MTFVEALWFLLVTGSFVYDHSTSRPRFGSDIIFANMGV
jgi:hypothetical protein